MAKRGMYQRDKRMKELQKKKKKEEKRIKKLGRQAAMQGEPILDSVTGNMIQPLPPEDDIEMVEGVDQDDDDTQDEDDAEDDDGEKEEE